LISNIGKDNLAVEDWWVNPKYVDLNRLNSIIDTSDKIKKPRNIFIK
jgi:hypothetical protein